MGEETLIRMPKLADTLVEGTLGRWLRQVGQEVGAGEPLASIETDKVTSELSSPTAGTLLEVLVAEGQTVAVETPLARIGSRVPAEPPAPRDAALVDTQPSAASSTKSARQPEATAPSPTPTPIPVAATSARDDEAGPPSPKPPSVAAKADRKDVATPPSPKPASVAGKSDRGDAAAPPSLRPTPVAARLLADHGLSPDQVPARSGRLTKNEVLAHLRAASAAPVEPPLSTPPSLSTAPAAEPPAASPAGELVPLSSMRRAIAEHMLKAYHSIPQGQTVVAADLSDLAAWRDAHKVAFQQTEGAGLTFTVCFVYALAHYLARSAAPPVDLAAAARREPVDLAAAARREPVDLGAAAGRQPVEPGVAPSRGVDLGLAVALEGGLIVPVLRAADALSLGATARGISDLANRARTNRLSPADTQGALMTVTNVGSFGNLTASPIVPLSQFGILGTGLVEPRPMPGTDGGIRAGWRCLVSLTFDRRALSDFAADRFLQAVVAELVSIPHQAV